MTVRPTHWILLTLMFLGTLALPVSAATVAPTEFEIASASSGASPAGSAEAGPTLAPEERRFWQTGLGRTDRLQHASFAFTTGLMIGMTTEDPAWAAAGAMALGVAKEVIDIGGTGFDVVDLVADLIGALSASAVTDALVR